MPTHEKSVVAWWRFVFVSPLVSERLVSGYPRFAQGWVLLFWLSASLTSLSLCRGLYPREGVLSTLYTDDLFSRWALWRRCSRSLFSACASGPYTLRWMVLQSNVPTSRYTT